MQHHNQKQRKIFQNIPRERRIGRCPAIDFICGHQKPRPMQKQVNPSKPEQTDRPIVKARHGGFISWGFVISSFDFVSGMTLAIPQEAQSYGFSCWPSAISPFLWKAAKG